MNKFLPTFVCALLLAIVAHAEDVQFVSTGKILVGGADFSPKFENGDPVPDSFYGTACEMMMGTRIQKGAAVRVHSLHPDFTHHAVKIKAEQSPKTSILVIRVTSEDGIYARTMADAVMDEFTGVWREIKGNSYEWQIVLTQDQIVRTKKDVKKVEKDLKDMERDKVEPAEMDKGKALLNLHNKRCDALLTRLYTLEDARSLATDIFAIFEHASEAEKVQKAP